MPLNGKQKHYLRGLAHGRRSMMTIGSAGVTPAVLQELNSALGHHELLKVKLPALDRDQRESLLLDIVSKTNCEVVQQIGRVGVIYRAAQTPIIQLP